MPNFEPHRAAVILWLAVLLLSGCIGSAQPSPDAASDSEIAVAEPAAAVRTFGIVYPMANSSYELITLDAGAYASDHAVKLVVTAPDEANGEQQIRIMESMIKNQVDGIAIAPVDAVALAPVIDKAVAAGIPVICFESDAPGSSRLAYVGADNFLSGQRIASMVSSQLGGKGMVLVENGMSEMLSNRQRLEGFLDYLNRETNVEVLEVRYNEGKVEQATADIEEMIDAHPHFNAMIGLDYVSSSAATLIWKAKGLNRHSFTLGFTPAIDEALFNGQITGVLSQNERRWGEHIVATLLAIGDGTSVPNFVDTGIAAIGP